MTRTVCCCHAPTALSLPERSACRNERSPYERSRCLKLHTGLCASPVKDPGVILRPKRSTQAHCSHKLIFLWFKEFTGKRGSKVRHVTWLLGALNGERGESKQEAEILLGDWQTDRQGYARLGVEWSRGGTGARLCNTSKPSGHYIYRQFNIRQFYVLPTQCVYAFCVDLRTNSDYFPIQH